MVKELHKIESESKSADVSEKGLDFDLIFLFMSLQWVLAGLDLHVAEPWALNMCGVLSWSHPTSIFSKFVI